MKLDSSPMIPIEIYYLLLLLLLIHYTSIRMPNTHLCNIATCCITQLHIHHFTSINL